MRLATHLHDSDAYVDARGYLEELLALRPDVADLHARYAHILSQFEEWPQAFESAELSLKLDPTSLKMRNWLRLKNTSAL